MFVVPGLTAPIVDVFKEAGQFTGAATRAASATANVTVVASEVLVATTRSGLDLAFEAWREIDILNANADFERGGVRIDEVDVFRQYVHGMPEKPLLRRSAFARELVVRTIPSVSMSLLTLFV